jgi:uncharacterized membrane protein
MPFVIGLAIIATVVLVVLLAKFVLPDNKREALPKVGKILHDIFNFKFLILEYILKITYIIATVFCVVLGVLMLFGFSHYSSGYFSSTSWYGGYGILLALFGPIAIRITYEAFMMFILLVKNTIDINKKLKNPEDENK